MKQNGSSEFHKLEIEEKNFYQVFLLYRNLEKNCFREVYANLLSNSTKKPDNVIKAIVGKENDETIKSTLTKEFNIIIVTREEFETLYGPTLSFLGQFWSKRFKLPQSVLLAEGLSEQDNLNSQFVEKEQKKKKEKEEKIISRISKFRKFFGDEK